MQDDELQVRKPEPITPGDLPASPSSRQSQTPPQTKRPTPGNPTPPMYTGQVLVPRKPRQQEQGANSKEPQPPSIPERRQATPVPKSERAKKSSGGTMASLWAMRAKYRWVLGLVALGVALLAQKLASDTRAADGPAGVPPLLSWALFALAAVIFVAAVPGSPAPSAAPTTPFLATLRAMRRRWLFIGLLGAAVLCDLIALPLFLALSSGPTEEMVIQAWPINTGSWLLYIASLLLFGAAWVVWERSASATPLAESSKPSTVESEKQNRGIPNARIEWAVTGVLFVAALLLRVVNLDSAPPGLWFDEAQNGIVGRGLLAPDAIHPAFISSYTQMGAFFFYIMGLVLKLFGDTLVWPLRLLPAIAGALLVPMLYLIGARLYGWRVGVAAAALLAVSGWNITFSRMGFATLPTIALDVAVFLCLLQGLRTGRLGYYAGAGVLLGLALQMYYAAQLVSVVLLLVFLYRLITERARFWRAVRPGLLLFAVGALLAVLPVGTFAIKHPEAYTQRTGTVSIFSPEGSDGQPDALARSISKHALMFNYAGDANGRHNAPGDPMLDWWTGALFIAGIGVCLLRIRRWHYFYPLVWFLISMSGGVLTVIFEAPQSHRTLENSVVTALIAGIFLGELCGALTVGIKSLAQNTADKVQSVRARSLKAAANGATYLLLVPVLLLAAQGGIDHYFNVQMNNQAVWLEMLGQDRAVGKYLAQYGGTHEIYVSAVKANYATGIYQAPNVVATPWLGMYTFPLTVERDTEIILTPGDGFDVVGIKRAYPNAVVEVLYGPNKTDVQLYSVTIPVEDIKALRGVRATILPKDGTKPPVEKMLPAMEFDSAGKDAQDAGAADVRLSTTLKISDYGSYSFEWADGNSEAKQAGIAIDGFEVGASAPVTLGAGLHSVVVTATAESTASSTARLLWKSTANGGGNTMTPISDTLLFDPRKIEPRGLTSVFRKGDSFDAPAEGGHVDPVMAFQYHITPIDRPYTGEWAGKLYAPVDGTYKFFTEQVSRSRLFIDGHELIVNENANQQQSQTIELQTGLHDIKLLYEDEASSSHLYLSWTPPGISGQYIIPSAFLLPLMGSYPQRPESGDWPSLDQADDTIWTKSAESQGAEGATQGGAEPTLATVSGLATPQPTAQVVTTAAPDSTQPPPTPQQEEVPTALPAATPAPQTTPRIIEPILQLGKDGPVLDRPKAAAIDPAGNIYIYTENDGTIHKFAPDGKPQNTWVVAGKDNKPANEISALAVKDGKLLALDALSAEIISYGLDGSGGERKSLCDCFFPRDMFIAGDGNFWVADTGGSRVIKVSPDGNIIASVGSQGSGPGEFVEPAGVWQAADGTLYVTDISNNRVQSFDADLKPVAAWTVGDSTARDGNRVSGDAAGALVTEYASKAIVRYDAQGKELARWVYNDTADAPVPSSITPAGDGKFLVLFPFDNLALLFDAGR